VSNNEKLESALKEIKKRFPKFCWEDSVKKAFEQCSYMETFPEDYNDNYFDVEDLKGQLGDLRYGFEALFDLFVKPVPNVYKITVNAMNWEKYKWEKVCFYLKGMSGPTEREASEILKSFGLLKDEDSVESVEKVEGKDKTKKLKFVSKEVFDRCVVEENGKNVVKYFSEK